MTDELARLHATDYVLQRYHLKDLEEARQKLEPQQYEGVLREIETVQAHLLAPPAPRQAAAPGIGALRGLPPVTALLLLAIWVVFIVELLYPGGTTDATFFTFGAVTPDTLATHQFWRLVFACFLHVSIYHIASNSIALFWLGSFTERLYGPLRYLGIYLAAGIGGNLLVVLTQNSGVGASGAILGLLGALLAGFWHNRRVIDVAQARQMFRGLAVTLVLNLLIGLIPGISLQAHLGGAVTGGVLALLIPFRSPRYPRPYALAANALSAILIVITLALAATYLWAH